MLVFALGKKRVLLLHLIAICGESKSKNILNSCKKLFSRILSDSDCIYISIGWLLFFLPRCFVELIARITHEDLNPHAYSLKRRDTA